MLGKHVPVLRQADTSIANPKRPSLASGPSPAAQLSAEAEWYDQLREHRERYCVNERSR